MMDSGDGTKTPPKCSSVSSFGESFRWRECAGGSIFNSGSGNPFIRLFSTKLGLFLNDLHWFGKHRENDKEGAALAHSRLDPHASLMSFNNRLDDRQPQP